MEETMHARYSSSLIGSVTHHKLTPHSKQSKITKCCLMRALFAVLISLSCAAPVMAASNILPPIAEPASQERHVGKMIFVELVTPDLTAAKKFYSELFGWTYRDIQVDGIEYAEAFLDDRPVAGLIHKDIQAGEHRQLAWRSFFSVNDVDIATKAAVQNGAKVLFEPHNIPDRGREAIIADPQGAIFAVLASSSGDPSDVLAEPGEWIWSSLHTSDPDADAAFYQTVFNYDVFELPPSKKAQHLLLASDNYARASINTLSANKSHPHWLNYVRVEDAEQMADKVVELGGRILIKPHKDRHGGEIAVVSDPQGAPFGLFEWSDTNSKEVSK